MNQIELRPKGRKRRSTLHAAYSALHALWWEIGTVRVRSRTPIYQMRHQEALLGITLVLVKSYTQSCLIGRCEALYSYYMNEESG